MNIYQIDERIKNAFRIEETGEYVDTDTGEVFDSNYLDELMMAREEKVENVALWIKNLDAESTAIKAEVDKLKRRIEANNKKSESLKNYLEYVLNGDKFSTARVAISYRKSSKVEVEYWLEDKITKSSKRSKLYQFHRTKTIDEVDKTALKAALKDGLVIDGARIVETTSMQIK